MPRTRICDELGIEHPILSVGFAAAGTCEFFDAVLPAGEVVRRIAAEADEVLARVSGAA